MGSRELLGIGAHRGPPGRGGGVLGREQVAAAAVERVKIGSVGIKTIEMVI